MASSLFVNLVTDDLPRSRDFYTALGWDINPNFSDDNAICVVISEHNYLMVLRRDFYQSFLEGTGKTAGDAKTTSLALISFDLESREAVDEFVQRVQAAGGTVGKVQDLGFMYQAQFDDPDGNHFEPFYMDETAAQNGPPQD